MSATNHDSRLGRNDTEGGQDLSADQARQGMETHRIRWVLAISLALGIAALSASWVWYSATSHASREAGPSAPATQTH
jgi:hypothetical protein